MAFRLEVALGAIVTLGTGIANASDGQVDASFAFGGVRLVHYDDAVSPVASAVAIDGKILIASHVVEASGETLIGVTRLLSDGGIDTSFSFDGNAFVDYGENSHDGVLGTMVLQSDGKMLLIGSAKFDGRPDFDFVVRRLNADGTVDTAFGDGAGTVRIAFDSGASSNTYSDIANAAAISSDGHIIVAGQIDNLANGIESQDFGIARLSSDGSLDFTFNGSGKVKVPFNLTNGAGSDADAANAVAIDTDGNTFVAGYAFRDSVNSDMAVAKLLPNGQRDPNFDIDGRATIAFDLGDRAEDSVVDLMLSRDGNLVVAGPVSIGSENKGWAYDFGVARLRPDGSLDATFSSDGKMSVAFDLYDGFFSMDRPIGASLQTDGKIVIAGFAQTEAQESAVAVARVLPNGTLDSTFGTLGKTHVSIDLGAGDAVQQGIRPAMQSGRPVIAVGVPLGLSGDGDFAAIRLENELIFSDGF